MNYTTSLNRLAFLVLFAVSAAGHAAAEVDVLEWTEVSPQTEMLPVADHDAMVFQGSLWRLGGSESKQVWRSEDGFNWERQPDAAWSGRSGHVALEFNDEIYVIGGYGGSRLNDVWHSADGISWTKSSTPPWSARTAHGAVVHEDKLWVFGGRSNSQHENDVWYSSDGETWTEVTSEAVWWPRRGFQTLVHEGAMWILGGWNESVITNEVWRSTDGINWTEAESVPWEPRFAHAATVHDGRMYIAGGDNDGYLNDVWSSADGLSWRQENEAAPWAEQRHLTISSFDGRIWLIGQDPSSKGLLDFPPIGTSKTTEIWYTEAVLPSESPGVTVRRAEGQADATNQLPVNFAVEFSDAVAGVDEEDFVFFGSAEIGDWTVTEIDEANYHLAVTSILTDGSVRPRLVAGAAANAEGDLSLVSESLDTGVAYDTTPPSVFLSSDVSVETSADLVGITINITVSSSTLSTGSLVCDNCSVSSLVKTGLSYVAQISPLSEGLISIHVAAGAVTDEAGNESLLSNTLSFIFLEATEGETSEELLWTEVSPLASLLPVADHKSVVFQGALWRLGGSESRQVWRSEDGFNWERQPDAAWSGRSGHEIQVFNDELWVMGGYGGTRKKDVWKSSDGVVWEKMPDAAWRERTAFGSATYDGKLWVFGGRSDLQYENDVWFSEDGETWTEASEHAPWWPRRGLQSVVFKDSIWMLGGWNGEDITNEVWSTQDGIEWTQAANAPWESRFAHAATVHNGRIYIAGGDNNGYLNDVWSTDDGESWQIENEAAPWPEQRHLSITSFLDRVWLVGLTSTSSSIPFFSSGTNRVEVWYTGRLVGSERPSVTVNQAAGQADPTNALPTSFTIQFSEPVTGLDLSGILLDGTATGIEAELGQLDEYTYALSITSVSSDGTIIASILEGAVEDADGNLSLGSTSTDNTISYDSTPPTVTLSSESAPSTTTSPIPVTVTFSEPVAGVTSSSFAVTNGSVSNVNGSGNSYTLEVVPTAEGTVSIAAIVGAGVDVSGNSSLASDTLTIEYSDGEEPVKTVVTISRAIDAPGGAYTPGAMLDVVVTFRREGPELIKPLILNETLPEGWSYVEVIGGPRPNAVNVSNDGSQVSFQWTTADDFSFNLIYRVYVPEDTSGKTTISGFAHYGVWGVMYSTAIVNTHVPHSSAALNEESPEGEEFEGDLEGLEEPHSMDADGDEIISLDEILRAIQLFNAGGISCAASATTSEDGYLPGIGEDQCRPHAGDYAPTDWELSMTELLRLIQFYNLGGCYPCPESGSEDGYCVGSR